MCDGSKYAIAVVDDDSRMLESLESLLESAGHRVRLFLSAEAFIASGALGQVDCVISDIGMPGMDGFALLRLVGFIRSDLPVFLITGREEISRGQPTILLPPERFFRKPFDAKKFLCEVADALRRNVT